MRYVVHHAIRINILRLPDQQGYIDANLGWHPGFSKYNNVDGYYFGTSSVSYSTGLSVGVVSVSVSKAGSSGTLIRAYGNKMTRPRVQGEVYKTVYKVQVLDR